MKSSSRHIVKITEQVVEEQFAMMSFLTVKKVKTDMKLNVCVSITKVEINMHQSITSGQF